MGKLDQTLRRLDPVVVGVTAMSDSFRSALEVCRRVKAWNPSAPRFWEGSIQRCTTGGFSRPAPMWTSSSGAKER